MQDEELYRQVKTVARQLCDIMQKRDLEDISELKDWLEKNNAAPEVIRLLMDGEALSGEIENYRLQDKDQAVNRLSAQIRRCRIRRLAIRFSGVAAAVVLIMGIWFINKPSDVPVSTSIATEIAASCPLLILGDGTSINLNNDHFDSVAVIPGSRIVYKNNKELEYPVTPGGCEYPQSLNCLIIPRQCNYQVCLSDGTKVYLNAESRLEYPACFDSNERKVYLWGEGYFEVKNDGRPFIVEVQKVNVRVYGTKFNINAYEGDEVETVLVEGKVGVSLKDRRQGEQLLAPAQLCRINLQTSTQEVVNVDVEKYISWTTGFLRYEDDRLEDLVKDIGRWYGVDFLFADEKLKDIRVFASINKDNSLEDIIAMIQTTVKLTINHTERRYTIRR